jgi:hypothetical protein
MFLDQFAVHFGSMLGLHIGVRDTDVDDAISAKGPQFMDMNVSAFTIELWLQHFLSAWDFR